MMTKTELSYNTATIHLFGRFDFSARHDMCKAFAEALTNPRVVQIVIDLAEVSYIDSSAFGQLLIAREKTRVQHKGLSVGGARGYVQKIFECTHFDKHFQATQQPAGNAATAVSGIQ